MTRFIFKGFVISFMALASIAIADVQNMTFFRIGTGGSGGTYYPIGGLLAMAVSNPPGGHSCEHGGSFGVPNLIAVAQSANGSVANVTAIQSGSLESGFAQSDVAYWAYTGTETFKGKPRMEKLRTIANLYPESLHLVARIGSGINSVQDLRGKHVSLDEPGSGTLIDARIVLDAYGLSSTDFKAEYIKPNLAVERIMQDKLDAFFIVAGYPTNSIKILAAEGKAKLIPIDGPEAKTMLNKHRFFSGNKIPAGTYAGIGEIYTVSVGAQWMVGADVDEDLVYAITRALWNKASRKLLDNGHAKGKIITLESALDGVSVQLHPGAERYYKEVGVINKGVQ